MTDYEEGETFYPPKQETLKSKTEVRGSSWSAALEPDGKIIFEYISGDITGKSNSFEITDSEFDGLRDESISDVDLIIKYRAVEGVGYFAKKRGGGYDISFPSGAHVPRDFLVFLTAEEFEIIRNDHDRFDEIIAPAIAAQGAQSSDTEG